MKAFFSLHIAASEYKIFLNIERIAELTLGETSKFAAAMGF
jgi:hypothetical protein